MLALPPAWCSASSRQLNAPLAWTDEVAQMFLVWPRSPAG
jgi:hypothetical protein